MMASLMGEIRVVEYLISAGASINVIANGGYTACSIAGNYEVKKLVCKK